MIYSFHAARQQYKNYYNVLILHILRNRFRSSGHRPRLASLVSRARPAGGLQGLVIASLRRRPHCVRWRPPLRWAWWSNETMTTARIDSPGRSLRSRFASPPVVNRSVCEIPVRPLPRRGGILLTASPLGEEEPGLGGAREGDTCLSPGAMQGRGSR